MKHKNGKAIPRLHWCLIWVVILSLVGCTIHVKNETNIDGFCFSKEKKIKQGEENFDVLKKRYSQEWQLNRADKNAPPELGLSMSGGGMRSAAFNIGVLKGLQKIGKLSEIDIMSSVSGGGYALSWYYLQRFNAKEDDAVIFDATQRFQKHLEDNGRIVTHSSSFLVEFPEYLFKLGTNVAVLPFHWLANGLFDWRANLAPYRWFYQNAIEREFHLTPNAKATGFLNDSSFMGFTVGVKENVEFPDMRKFIEEKRLPSFVINATAAITDSPDHHGADLSNAIFEFTPYHFGSDAFGYRSDDFPVDIHTAVAISGAAVDSSIIPAQLGLAMSALNTDLGYNIPNHNITERSKIVRHNLMPFPFYFTYRYNNDIRGTRIYLSDGGHSENLGAFALVRRMCKHIIIVDAEHDPDYRFSAYRKLKTRLKKELRVDFSIPEIDNGLIQYTFDFVGNERLYDNQVPADLPEKIGFSPKMKVSYDQETGFWRLTDKQPDGKTYFAQKEKDKLIVYRLYDGSKPVMKGCVAWFPLQTGNIIDKVILKVTYIKLSLDLQHLEKYPPSVSSYYQSERHWFKELTGYQNTPFPHEDTSDLSYGKDQFSAYRDLGCYLVDRYFGGDADQALKDCYTQN